jgi:hypothetical protein
MHPDANLQNAFVQVSNFARCRAPQQLERLMLFEELAAIELVDGFVQLRRRRIGAGRNEVCLAQPVEGPRQLGMRRTRIGRSDTERYTGSTLPAAEEGHAR